MSDTTVLEPEPAEVGDTLEPAEEVPPARSHRSAVWYTVAVAVGSVLATFLFAWTITTGSFDFDRRVPFGDNLYDVQARRLFDGRWDMPLSVVGRGVRARRQALHVLRAGPSVAADAGARPH